MNIEDPCLHLRQETPRRIRLPCAYIGCSAGVVGEQIDIPVQTASGHFRNHSFGRAHCDGPSERVYVWIPLGCHY